MVGLCALPLTLRRRPHRLRTDQGRRATPSSQLTFTTYSLPVSPGALTCVMMNIGHNRISPRCVTHGKHLPHGTRRSPESAEQECGTAKHGPDAGSGRSWLL